MSVRICPSCRNRQHRLMSRCECGYDFEQRKMIPFSNAEEKNALLTIANKEAVRKGRKLAAIMIALGVLALILAFVLFKMDAGAIFAGVLIAGFVLLVKGLLDFFSGDVDI